MAKWIDKLLGRKRLEDGISVSGSGLGGACDMSASTTPAYTQFAYGTGMRPDALENYTSSVLFGANADAILGQMYRIHWEAQKVIDIPADDMTREGWEWKSASTSPENIESLNNLQDDLCLAREINLALKYEGVYGGGLVFIGVAGDEDPETPLRVETIRQGGLAYFRALPRFMVSAVQLNNNPLDPNYRRPEIFTIRGQQVHRSRFLIFSGLPFEYPMVLAGNIRSGFGESRLVKLYQDINNAEAIRQHVAHLVNKVSIQVYKTKGVAGKRATKQGNLVLEQLLEIIRMSSNFKAVLLDQDDSLETHSSTFESAANLIQVYLGVVGSAADIPATRFLGESPGGLNATGTSDLENYYNRIGADQTNRLKPQLIKAGDIMCRSLFGSKIDDLSVEFNSLWQQSDAEQSTTRTNDTNNIVSLFNAGIIEVPQARKEAVEREILLNDPEDAPIEPLNLGEPNALVE